MKKAALYILLFAYSTAMLKPVSPYIADAFAHAFYYTQHMATVHYENGKLHVHKEIVDNAEKDESSKENPSAKKDNTASEHIILQQKDAFHCLQTRSYNLTTSSCLVYQTPGADYPPPKARNLILA
ncbi:MAG: hypothetical protein IPP96_12495 [Chitinophagaceae bacterium]|nr:hypothetical protein [Chitinophagaceae bacterium]